MPAASPDATCWRRRLRRVLLVTCFLTVGFWCLYRFALPAYLRSVVADELDRRGFSDASFQLAEVSLSRLTLRDLQLDGNGRLSAGELILDYDFWSLLRGEIDTVSIRGVRWQIAIEDRHLRSNLPARSGTLDIAALPASFVAFSDAAVDVHIRGRVHHFAVEGTIRRTGPGRVELAGRGTMDGIPLLLAGFAGRDPAGSLEAAVEARLARAGDRALFQAAYRSGSEARLEVALQVSWQGLAIDALGQTLRMRNLDVDADVALVGATLQSASMSASAEEVSGAGYSAQNVRLTVAEDRDRLAATLSATGGLWHLGALEVSMGRDLSTWSVANSRLSWRLSSVASDSVRERLRRAGVKLGGDAVATLVGRGTLERTSREGWRLIVHHCQIDFSTEALVIARAKLHLGRLRADVKVKGTIATSLVDLRVAAGSVVDARRIGHRDGTLFAAGEPERAPALALTVEGPSRLRFPFSERSSEWLLDAPSVDVRVRGIYYLSSGIKLHRLGGILRLSVEARAGRLVVKARHRSGMAFSALRIGGERAVSLRGCRPTLLVSKQQPLAVLEMGRGRHPGLALDARLRCGRPVEVRGALVGRIREVEASVRARVGRRGLVRLEVPVLLRASRISAPAVHLAISDARLALPLRWGGDEPPGGGRLTIGEVAWRGRPLGSLGLAVRHRGARAITANGRATLLGLRIAIAGSADLGAEKGGRVQLELPVTRVSSQAPLARLATELAGVRVRGRIAGEADIVLGSCGREDRGWFELSDVTLSSADGATSLAGLDATVAFESFRGAKTAGRQRLRWRSTRFKRYELGSGKLDFSLEAPRRVVIHGARVSTGGGRVEIAPMSFDPLATDIAVELRARGIRLSRWLPILSRGRATGAGILDGSLQIQLRRVPQLRLDLGEGVLSTRGGGWFKIGDEELLAEAIGGAAFKQGYGQQVRDRIVRSLSNFGYRRLRFDLLRERGHSKLRIRTEGRGRKVPQEINLTVNVSGIDELMSPSLRQWLDE